MIVVHGRNLVVTCSAADGWWWWFLGLNLVPFHPFRSLCDYENLLCICIWEKIERLAAKKGIPCTNEIQWRSEDVGGPWTMDSPGPLPILLWQALSHTPCSKFTHVCLFYRQIWFYTALFNQFISDRSRLYTWCILEIWVPLMTRCGKWGPFDDAMINYNWDLLITLWEIRGHHFDDMLRKPGALHGATENFVPFDDATGKLETLAMGKLGPPDDLMGEIGALDHKLFSNGLIRLRCALSNSMAPDFNWEILDDMQAEKIHEAPIPIFRLIFRRLCDDYQCLILVFSVIYLDSCNGDISGGWPSSGFWKVLFPLFFSSYSFSFLFFFFSFSFVFSFVFSFLFFSSFSILSLSRGPFSSGAPGHCPPMPPSRYATDEISIFTPCSGVTLTLALDSSYSTV